MRRENKIKREYNCTETGTRILFHQRMFRAAIILCCIVIIGSIIAYHFTPTINSDTVDGVIWAEASIRSGRLLSDTFVYGYVIPFGAHIFQIPFVAMLGANMLAETIGMLCFFSVFLAVCFLYARSITKNWLYSFIVVTILVLSYRSGYGINLAHHVLHYQLGFVIILGMYAMVFRIIKEKTLKKRTYLGLLAFAFWSGANGVVTITLSFLPIAAALIMIRLLHSTLWEKKLWYILMVSFLGVFFGIILYLVATKGVKESEYLQSTSFTFLSVDDWISNIREIPQYWLELFVVQNLQGKPVISIDGIIAIISVAVALVVFVCLIVAIYKRSDLTIQQLLVLYGTLAIWLVTVIQVGFIRGPERRMLYNVLCANFILITVLVFGKKDLVFKPQQRLILAGVGGIMAFYAIMFPLSATWKINTQLTDVLEEQGLEYGFSTFWNASYNTVVSDNRVKIRPIMINKGNVYPRYYNSDETWYDPERNPELKEQTRFFLLVDQEEYDMLMDNRTDENSYIASVLSEEFDVQADVITQEYVYERRSSKGGKELEYNNDHFHVLVFPIEQIKQVLDDTTFIYRFTDGEYSINCDTTGGIRYIRDGGVSFGPYIHVDVNQTVRATIRGQNLDHGQISVYSMPDNIFIEPDYILNSSNEIQLNIYTDTELTALEVAVTNSGGDLFTDDILLTDERLEILSDCGEGKESGQKG